MKPGADSSEQSLEYAEGRKERGDGWYLSRSLPCFQRFFFFYLEVLLTLWAALVFEG